MQPYTPEQIRAANKLYGFLTIVTLIFVALKLASQIAWSWWWVLSPLLIPLSLAFGTAVIAGIVIGIIKMVKLGLDQ